MLSRQTSTSRADCRGVPTQHGAPSDVRPPCFAHSCSWRVSLRTVVLPGPVRSDLMHAPNPVAGTIASVFGAVDLLFHANGDPGLFIVSGKVFVFSLAYRSRSALISKPYLSLVFRSRSWRFDWPSLVNMRACASSFRCQCCPLWKSSLLRDSKRFAWISVTVNESSPFVAHHHACHERQVRG